MIFFPIAGIDFDATPQNAILRAGQTEVCVNISITDDGVSEGSEQFCVEISSSSTQLRGDTSECDVCVTITDPTLPTG